MFTNEAPSEDAAQASGATQRSAALAERVLDELKPVSQQHQVIFGLAKPRPLTNTTERFIGVTG